MIEPSRSKESGRPSGRFSGGRLAITPTKLGPFLECAWDAVSVESSLALLEVVEAGGFPANSRWLSAAIPPDLGHPEPGTPAGVQASIAHANDPHQRKLKR